MSFENPKGLLLLLGIPVLIIIHLVKSKHEDHPVASTYIWKLADKFMKQVLPMQKLKKFLVFLFQFLAVAGAALIVSRPIFYSGNSIKYIAVLDSSASMLMQNGKGETRFDRALEGIRKLTKKINNGHTLSIISASDEAYYLIQDSSSISDVDILLDNTVCSMGSCDIDAALALAQETADRYPDTQVVLFTDAECRDMHNIDVVYVGDDTWNAAVLSLSYEEKNDLLYLYGSVVSTGMDAVLPVGLEIDGQILDVQLAECQDDVATEVTFKMDANRFRHFSNARIFLDVEDGLREDNSFSVCVEQEYYWKVRLISRNPRFLRSALDSIPHVALRVDSHLDPNLSGFHMYIFDGFYPEEYPSGSILIFGNQNLPEGVTVTGYSETPEKLKAAGASTAPLYRDMLLDNTYVSKYSVLRGSSLWDDIYRCGEDTVGVTRRAQDGSVSTVISFDVHDTNLPLQSDLTVMLRNLVRHSLPWIVEENDAYVGQELTVSLVPYEDYAFVTKPDGSQQSLAMEQSQTVFVPNETGVYRITEKSDEKTIYKDFFVHIPASESLKQELEGYSIDRSSGNIWSGTEEQAPKAGTHLAVWIAAAVLLFILAEWGISCREEL